jgi:YVTN family beta-propeller protein
LDKNVYVSNSMSDTVDVINPNTNTVVNTIITGHRPHGLTYDSTNGQVFVVEQGNPISDIPARVFSLTVSQGVDLPDGAVPIEIKYDAFNDRLYVSDRGLNQVHVINPNTLEDIADISLGSNAHPWGMAVDPYNGYVFVADQGTNKVSVISGVSTVPSSLATGSSPTGIVFDPVYQFIFVTNNGGNSISRFNATGNDASSYFSLGATSVGGFLNGPAAIAIDCTHNTLWIANDGSGLMTEIGLCPGAVYVQKTVRVWATVAVGDQPDDIAYDSHTHAIYVANQFSNSVTSIETDTLTAPPGQGCPQGVVDYGLNGNQKYHYTTTAFESVTTIFSATIGDSTVVQYNNEASLQLNVIDYGVATSIANGVYWTQDVMSIANAGAALRFNKTTTTCVSLCVQFTGEIFNFTQNGAPITYKEGANSVFKYKCNDNGTPGNVSKEASTYFCDTPWEQGITLPITVKLLVITGTETSGPFNGQNYISFQYLINSGIHANKWIEFDRLHFNNLLSGTRIPGNPLFTVSGSPLFAPDGVHPDDAEIVFCGYAASASVAFTSLQASMWLLDLNSTAHGFTFVPHSFASGSDTAETTNNLYIKPTHPRGTVQVGGDNTGQLY